MLDMVMMILVEGIVGLVVPFGMASMLLGDTRGVVMLILMMVIVGGV